MRCVAVVGSGLPFALASRDGKRVKIAQAVISSHPALNRGKAPRTHLVRGLPKVPYSAAVAIGLFGCVVQFP